MDTALLLGRDPVFAWALHKVMADLGLALEHVYTLSEAKIRLERFSYRLILLDGLRPEEVDTLGAVMHAGANIILFDADPSQAPLEGMKVLSKDSPLQSTIASLKESLR